jgi:pyocin large subunit-like protein
LRDAPVGGDIVEVVRQSDGVISRFDRGSGAFLAADPDGTIRTFFKPNDGEAYFRRQARRSPRS